ncbi:hypothetical protein LMG27177_05920 [Paraburkholderia fynbosensis]|uniref:Transposase n=1 Tax=Paraburkholderia fynbosensis TaxID=1200993 RepID=A0A6J5GRM6_9BURK|nr:hypothetical protein LMG27177_05920 [Paraburkholderia fynbosensis]
MRKPKSLDHGHRFPASIISHAVRWYFRFQLSLPDIEELLFERGVVMTAADPARRSVLSGTQPATHSGAPGRRLPGQQTLRLLIALACFLRGLN